MGTIDDRLLHKQQQGLTKEAGSLIDTIEDFIGKDEDAFFRKAEEILKRYDMNKATIQALNKTVKQEDNHMVMDDKALTPEQVSEILQVPVKSIKNWMRAKTLQGFKAGREWRVMESDLKDFIARKKQQSGKEKDSSK